MGVVSLDQFCENNSISRATAYREISLGRLEARKIGRKTVVTKAAEKAWQDALPKFSTSRASAAA